MNVIVDIILYLKNVTVINRNFSYKSSKFEFDFYNTDSERSTENSMQKDYVQETKSPNSEFHPQEILLQSKNNENNMYNLGSGKVDTKRIFPVTNQNSNK